MIIYLGYNLPRFWEVTWVETYSPILDRNITEVVPTKLRLNQIYIEVSCLKLLTGNNDNSFGYNEKRSQSNCLLWKIRSLHNI